MKEPTGEEEKWGDNITVEEVSVFYWPDDKAQTRITGHDLSKQRKIWFDAIAPVPKGHIINATGRSRNVWDFLKERHRALKSPSQEERVIRLLGLDKSELARLEPEVRSKRISAAKKQDILHANRIDDTTAKILYTVA